MHKLDCVYSTVLYAQSSTVQYSTVCTKQYSTGLYNILYSEVCRASDQQSLPVQYSVVLREYRR